MGNVQLLHDCLIYLLESEFDDFKDNASENHIYYKASNAMYGEDVAEQYLQLALRGDLK